MAYNLSEGSLEMMMNGDQPYKPVLQVLNIKKVQGSGTNEKFHMLLFDGGHCQSASILATQLSNKLMTEELSEYSIVKINKYITSLLNEPCEEEKRVIIILDLAILVPGGEVGQKLGDPPTTHMIHPIASLCENQQEWVIKARVESKSTINEYSKPWRSGIWFSMHLCDESGRIRAVTFDGNCESIYDKFEMDKVYYISGCRVQLADPNFTKDTLELVIADGTVVAECVEDAFSGITVPYNFVPIEIIGNKPTHSLIDVIGVCISVDSPEEVDNAGCEKRDLTVADHTGCAIVVTLWNKEAVNFDEYAAKPVIAIKGARVKEYMGNKYLSCLASSMVRLNPDLPEAHKLRGWYKTIDDDVEFYNITAEC